MDVLLARAGSGGKKNGINLSPCIPLSLIKRGGGIERGAKPLLNTPFIYFSLL
jgi:hypothetical protein